MADSQRDINELLAKAAQYRNAAKKELEKQTKIIQKNKGLSEELARIEARKETSYKNQANALKEVVSQVNEAKRVQKENIETLMSQEKSLKSLTGLQASLVEQDRKRIKILSDDPKLRDTTKTKLESIASLNQQLLETSADDAVTRDYLQRTIQKELKGLQGLGEAGNDLKKIEEEKFQKALNVSSLTEHQQKMLNKQLDTYDAIKDTVGGIFDTLSLLTSGPLGFLGTGLIVGGAAGKKLLDTSYQLGGSLRDTSNIATTLFGTVFEDAVGTTKSLSKEFGGLSDVSLKTQFRTNVLAKNLGIGSAEAASLTGNFARLNRGSAETAQNLIQSTKNLAQQNGLVPADVMADLASSTEEFALFGKRGGQNLAEAVVAAGKLGVSMSEISGVANNLIDFESSINNELELGAMLGKNLNLNRARALAFEGEIGSALKETLNQLGGIEEFNKMDPIAKKKTADLLGVSVAQFQKMAENSDKLNKDGSIQVSQYDRLTQNAKAFGSQILSGAQALGGMLMTTGQINQGLSGMGERFKSVKKFFGAKPTGPLKTDGTPDMRFKSNKTTSMKSLSDKANPASKGGIMQSLGKINMNAVLKGAAAMVIVAGAVFVFGKAVQEFMKVSWEAVGMAVVSMLALVGAVALLGAIMSSGVGAIAILAGAAAMLVIAASVLVLGHALQEIGTGFEMMSTGISTLMPQLQSVATTIGALVLLIPAITLLGSSLMGLSASLIAFGVAGVLAAPGLMAIAAVGAVATGINSLLGGGDEGSGSDSDLISEIKGLREDLNNGKVAVYMDGQKVASSLSKVVNKIGSNSYAV